MNFSLASLAWFRLYCLCQSTLTKTNKIMRVIFVVLTEGFWGKGLTIEKAASECSKAGSVKSLNVVVRAIIAQSEAWKTHEDLLKAVSVNGCGDIQYPRGSECLRILSPVDGQTVKLTSLFRK